MDDYSSASDIVSFHFLCSYVSYSLQVRNENRFQTQAEVTDQFRPWIVVEQ